MLKRNLPVQLLTGLLLLGLLAGLPVTAFDYHSWRTDGYHVFGTSVGQQSSNQAFNIDDSSSDPSSGTYSLFWETEHINNGTATPAAFGFGDLPPSVPLKDNRVEDYDIDWDQWGPSQEKLLPGPLPRPVYTPQLPQAWSPVNVDLDTTGSAADHALVNVSLEPIPAVPPNTAADSGKREQIINLYWPQTNSGLPGNDSTVFGTTDVGTVRPFWIRGGDPTKPGLRVRDLAPLANSFSNLDAATGVVTQPLIFARVPANYTNSGNPMAAPKFSESLPVIYVVVGTGENGDFAKVICISLRKPSAQRDPTTGSPNEWLPTPGTFAAPPPAPTAPPPDPAFFDPTTATGGAVMWSYTVKSRTDLPNPNNPVPVAGISFANVGTTTDSRPLLFVTTADGQLICLNAKAADYQDLAGDGDPANFPVATPSPRWVWKSPTENPATPQVETPGFAYGMAPAVCRVSFTNKFSTVAADPSANTAVHAVANGLSEWMAFAADSYGNFWGWDAPGHKVFNATGTLTAITQATGDERWKVQAPNPTGRLATLDPAAAPPVTVRERFIIPPVCYQGNTPLRDATGATVSGSRDQGFDDEVIFASERGNVFCVDAIGQLNVNANAAVDGTTTHSTFIRWQWPTDDTAMFPAAANTEEPRVWPRELPDPRVKWGAPNPGPAALPDNAPRLIRHFLGGEIAQSAAYFSRGALAVALGANTNPNGASPNLDPGDDVVYVPYMQEQGATASIPNIPAPGSTITGTPNRASTRPANYRWFYEYIGSMKPYAFVQASRPIIQLNTATFTVGGVTHAIPVKYLTIGTVKFNGLSSSQSPTILAPGAGAPGANPNYDPSGPIVDDTVYVANQDWFEDSTSTWVHLPIGSLANPVTIALTYDAPTSPNNNTPQAVTETLDFPSCYRRFIPNLSQPTTFTIERVHASLSVNNQRLEERFYQAARAAAGPVPARPEVLWDEGPALVSAAAVAGGDLFQNSLTEGRRQPSMMAAGSASTAGVLMAPALFRGRIIALDHRLRIQRALLGCLHPVLLNTTAPNPTRTPDAVNGPHYGPAYAVAVAPELLNTYDPGVFYDEGPPFNNNPPVNPFLDDEVVPTDVGASVTLVDGWLYVTYRNGYTRAYANFGGGAPGSFSNPPFYQLPAPPSNGSLIEAPIGIVDTPVGGVTAPGTGVYFLVRAPGGVLKPTLTINDVLNPTPVGQATGGSLQPDARPMHTVPGVTLDRTTLLEMGQTLFVAVDYGPITLIAPGGPQSIDPNDPFAEIDPQLMQPGNEVQGQIRSSNGAVQQLPGINRGVLPQAIQVPWDTQPHVMAIVQVFCGIPSPSNPLTPGTPLLWEKNPRNANPFLTFQNELTYDIQVTQQGVQWRWPDTTNPASLSNNKADADKQHFWETEKNTGAVRFNNTGGTTDNTYNQPLPNACWGWTTAVLKDSTNTNVTDAAGNTVLRNEFAPLLTYNNPITLEYNPKPADPTVNGMIDNTGNLTDCLTRIAEYNGRLEAGRKNGDVYLPDPAGAGVADGRTVDGARSGAGRAVIPVVGVGIRKPGMGGGSTWAQQFLFADHGKTSPISTTRYPDVGKLRVADRSYMGYLGRTMLVRVQRSALTKMGVGADYATRGVAALRNLTGSPPGSFEQNINTWDDAPDQLYPSLSDSRVLVTKLGTNLDLSSSPVDVPGRDPAGRDNADQGLPAVQGMENLAVQVDVPLFAPDDLYTSRWRTTDASGKGSNPTSAFNPFFPFPSASIPGATANDVGHPFWDRAERFSRGPDPNAQELAALTTGATAEDPARPAAYPAISNANPLQNDRTRRIVIFNDANGNGQLDLLPTYREAYRTFAVQVAVKPEMKLEAQQDLIDLGNLWHGKKQPGMPGGGANEIREWVRMKTIEAGGTVTEKQFAAFWEQYWRPFNLLNTGNVNLAYVKPEVVYKTATTTGIIALPSDGNDPWRALSLINATNPTDPFQIFLRTSFDEQLLPTQAAFYGAATRGIWLEKTSVGSAQPSSATYVDPKGSPALPGATPTGGAADRDPGPLLPAAAGRNTQGVPRETAITLNLPTGAPLGIYSGQIRYYNDRTVAFDETPDNPNNASNPTIGFRYLTTPATNADGALARANDGTPLEPVTDPPLKIRARVIENMVNGRNDPVVAGGSINGVAPDPTGERRMTPTAVQDASSVDAAGIAHRFLLGFSSNKLGAAAANKQFGIYELGATQMLLDATNNSLLFPFDELPLLRPQTMAGFNEPWGQLTAPNNPGYELFTNEYGLTGATGQVSRPGLTQDPIFTKTALMAWVEHLALGPGKDQYWLRYQAMSPALGAIQTLMPGGVNPDVTIPRSNPRLTPVTLRNNTFAPLETRWIAFYGLGPRSQQTIGYSAFTAANGPKTNPGDTPEPTAFSAENALPVSKALNSLADPYGVTIDAFARAVPLTPKGGEPTVVANELTTLPQMNVLAYAGSMTKLGRTDIFLSRYRTSALLAAGQRGPAGVGNSLRKAEDYAQVRFPMTSLDILKANSNRTVYISGGADWLVAPYSQAQVYIAQPETAGAGAGTLVNPLALIPPGAVGNLTPEGEIVFTGAGQLIPAVVTNLPNFKLYIDPAAGVVRLSHDARTLAKAALGTGGGPTPADPVLFADYTAATMRVSRSDAPASSPIVVPEMAEYLGGSTPVPTYDASWYLQQTDPSVPFVNGISGKWVNGLPVAGRADRLWIFWRQTGAQGASGPGAYYKVLRPGIRVRMAGNKNIRAINGVQAGELTITVPGGPTPAAEEVNPDRGQIFFSYPYEGQTVHVQYRDAVGTTHDEDHVVGWEEETPETAVPMETSVNEGSLDAFASYEMVQMTAYNGGAGLVNVKKLERNWLFWGSTRGSAGDLFFATLAPRIGPEANVGGSVVPFSASAAALSRLSPTAAKQRSAFVAAYAKKRPYTLPPIVRRGPFLPSAVWGGGKPFARRASLK